MMRGGTRSVRLFLSLFVLFFVFWCVLVLMDVREKQHTGIAPSAVNTIETPAYVAEVAIPSQREEDVLIGSTHSKESHAPTDDATASSLFLEDKSTSTSLSLQDNPSLSSMPSVSLSVLPVSSVPSLPSVASPTLSVSPRSSVPYRGRIFLLWPWDSRLFHWLNHKSLESLLVVYAHASLSLCVLAPPMAHYYKVGGILSKTTLQKHAKAGLPVRTEIVCLDSPVAPAVSLPGHLFWRTQLNRYHALGHINGLGGARHADFFTTMYFAVSRLFAEGGVFTDFAWFHTDTLPPIVRLAEEMEKESDKSNNNTVGGYSFRNVCVPQIESDRHVGRKNKKNKKTKQENSNSDSNNDANENEICFVSTMLVFSRSHEALLCVLRRYEDTHFTKSCGRKEGEKLRDCLSDAFARCFASLRLTNDLAQYTHTPTHSQSHTLSLNATLSPSQAMHWLGERAFAGDWRRPPTHSPLSLAIQANDRALSLRRHNHLYHSKSSVIVTNEALHSINVNGNMNTSASTQESASQCSHYHTLPNDPVWVKEQARSSCAMHFVLPGFMKAGSSFLFDTLTNNHPLLLRPLKGVQFKESGCYSSLSQGKTRNSPDFNARMSCFPLVEAHEEFVFSDATVTYAGRVDIAQRLFADNPRMRVVFAVRDAVARLASHHRFDYGSFRAKDLGDANRCVDIALDERGGRLVAWRELVERLLREEGEERIKGRDKERESNEEERPESVCSTLRELLSTVRVGLRSGASADYGKCASLFAQSLYALHVLQWLMVFNASQVRVIQSESLDALQLSDVVKRESLALPPLIYDPLRAAQLANVSASHNSFAGNEKKLENKKKRLSDLDHKYLLHQFNGIYRFLGVPTLSKSHITLGGAHESEPVVPPQHRLNETSLRRLREFFAPFDALLLRLFDRKMRWPCVTEIMW